MNHTKRLSETKPENNPFVTRQKPKEVDIIDINESVQQLSIQMAKIMEKPLIDRVIGISVKEAKTLYDGIRIIGDKMPEFFRHNRLSVVYIQLDENPLVD